MHVLGSYAAPMGIDAVDIVLRCEETFDLRLEDKDLGQIVTVGHLFEHLCTKLHLPNSTAAPEHPGTSYLRDRLSIKPGPKHWTREDVWTTFVALLVDQQGLKLERIRYPARLSEDLGID